MRSLRLRLAVGTGRADTLRGTKAPNLLLGGGGNDRLRGRERLGARESAGPLATVCQPLGRTSL